MNLGDLPRRIMPQVSMHGGSIASAINLGDFTSANYAAGVDAWWLDWQQGARQRSRRDHAEITPRWRRDNAEIAPRSRLGTGHAFLNDLLEDLLCR